MLTDIRALADQFLIAFPNINTEPTVLQHFYLGLSQASAQFLDLASKGAFLHLPVSEGKAVLATILENTPYTDEHNGPPEEETPKRIKMPKRGGGELGFSKNLSNL